MQEKLLTKAHNLYIFLKLRFLSIICLRIENFRRESKIL
jgi:hypothetical protein